MNQTQNDAANVTSEVFVVGDLRVDIGQQRVMRSGTEIPLPNLSFQLLVALIRAAPNVLSHDVLMARVWPGLVVSPETVNKRANLLREALGDDAREPRYIAGVRSRGYRLVAEITPVERQVAPPAALAPNAVPSTAIHAEQGVNALSMSIDRTIEPVRPPPAPPLRSRPCARTSPTDTKNAPTDARILEDSAATSEG